MFLPSDIEYEPDMLGRLVAHDVDVVAPLVWENDFFYDTWAFMKDGLSWPKFGRDKQLGDQLILMDSIGGTMLSKAAVLEAGVRYTEDAVDRGYSVRAREHGFALWCDPTTHVTHPDSNRQLMERYLRMAVR
jgi:GT2 family glycosyltransferase